MPILLHSIVLDAVTVMRVLGGCTWGDSVMFITIKLASLVLYIGLLTGIEQLYIVEPLIPPLRSPPAPNTAVHL